MYWLLIGLIAAASTWTVAMTKMERSATNIKNTAISMEEIASESVKNGNFHRFTEILSLNERLTEQITDAENALKRLKHKAQK